MAFITVASMPIWSAGDAVAVVAGDGHAAEDVAAADDDADLDAEADGLADLPGDPVDHAVVDAEGLVAEQRLAGNLQKHPLDSGAASAIVCRHPFCAFGGCLHEAAADCHRHGWPQLY